MSPNAKKVKEEPLVAYGASMVEPQEKTRGVQEIFARVAGRYDAMNDVMSLGIHRRWKDRMVAGMQPRAGMDYLDLASGTGDVAQRIAKRCAGSVRTGITLSDINPAMLGEGRARWLDDGMEGLEGIEARLVTASAESLPFGDRSFDHVSIAFGIRNVARVGAALREIYRVLKPGGRFTCLEFAPDVDKAVAGIYDIYSEKLIPQMGRWIAKDEAAYRYLVESIRSFPPTAAFARMLEDAGLARVGVQRMSFGVVAVHHGYRL